MAVHLGAAHRSADGQIDINGPSGLPCACTPTEEKMQRRDASCASQEMPREEKKRNCWGAIGLRRDVLGREGLWCLNGREKILRSREREGLAKPPSCGAKSGIWVQRRSCVGRGGERHTWPREWRSDREVTVVTETHWGEGDGVGDLVWDGADNLSRAGERIWWAGEVSAPGESRNMVAGWGGRCPGWGPHEGLMGSGTGW